MARLEQYSFDNLPFSPTVGSGGDLIIEDEHGQTLFENIEVTSVWKGANSARLLGRSAFTGSNASIRLSLKGNDGFLTLSYPSGDHQEA